MTKVCVPGVGFMGQARGLGKWYEKKIVHESCCAFLRSSYCDLLWCA